MVRIVYVWPLNLIGALYADLHGVKPVTSAVEMMYVRVDDGNISGFKVSMLFDLETSLVPAGHLRLGVAGRCLAGSVEAERSAIATMVEAVRTQYQLFPSDYNYMVISEMRALYNAMKGPFQSSRATYVDMSIALKDYKSALQDLCTTLSVWIGDKHPECEKEDIVVVSAFLATLNEQAILLDRDSCHADRLSEMVVLRFVEPEEQRRLEGSVSMPMAISWEGSFHCLNHIYTQAVKKLNGVVSNMHVVSLHGGLLKAVVHVSEEPFFFAGEPAHTKEGALAKLYYAVIKYVNLQLGYSIFDFHLRAREYQETYIDRFDRNMKSMLRCGEKLHQLFLRTEAVVGNSVGQLSDKLDINDHTQSVLHDVHAFSVILHASHGKLVDAWNRLQELQVDRSTLEAKLAAEA